MSSEQRRNGDYSEHSLKSDTFLSRVFGLHSIYNRLPENYQYYDQESQLSARPTSNGAEHQHLSSTVQLNGAGSSYHAHFSKSPDRNLLDSESDSELSSSDSQLPPSPLLQGDNPPASAPSDSPVNWKLETNRRNAAGYPESSTGATRKHNVPVHGLSSSHLPGTHAASNESKKLPTRSLTFQLPRTDAQNTSSESPVLPLYNIATSFKRQSPNLQSPQSSQYRARSNFPSNRIVIPPKERALYLWANIINMDEFLIDIYYYYRGKGFTSIVLARIVDICILIFVLSFSTFLMWGIDYDFFFNEWSSNSDINLTLRQLVITNFLVHRVPLFVKFLLVGFIGYIALRLLQLYYDYKYKLSQLQNFYKQLLGISDDLELMTISWSTIVERLIQLKDHNSLTATNQNLPPNYASDLNSKVRLNAHDIANRIMRKENYMIALINKDVLDLSISTPPFLKKVFSGRSVLTRTLEWNIKLCINNFVFNANGQINQNILKEASRNSMAQELSSRFKMAAIINLILCPFIVIYFVLLYFFRYFNEYKSNPSSLLGLRQYTPWAEWKLREFNELSHLFIKRLHLSVGPANTYINQFPGSVLVINLMTFINFVCGAILAVLVIFGLLFEDEEHNFWSFELTENRSTLFYISIFGTLWAVTSNQVNISTITNTAENLNTQGVSFFYDPEASLRYVSQFTHYLPSSWNGKLHTVEVKNEFCELYSLKIVIILNEILSLILTPFVLWFKVSNNSSAIIDFFREYTIHVDGLGYVCYFAMFNFEEKDKNMMHELNKRRNERSRKKKYRRKKDRHTSSKTKLSDSEVSSEESSDHDLNDYYQDDKMIKSYMYFLESYGNKSSNNKRGTLSANNGHTAPRAEAPSDSIVLGRDTWSGYNDSHGDLSFRDSSYHSPDTLKDSVRTKDKGRKGVLGMINQFSKQEPGR